MALFEAQGIYKRFGSQVVLENISVTFEEGMLSGIVGPNGAGKTTLFNVLTGRYRPDRGRITFRGRDITGKSEYQIAQMGVSRSFQIMNLFDKYTALDNILVALPALRERCFNPLLNVPLNSAMQDRAYQVLQHIGLDADAKTIAKSLPYGKRRALEIGVALATNPRILFLDEPTQGLGSDQTVNLIDLIQKLRQDVTIVVIEHDMDFLIQIADVISVVHWGQVIAQGTPADLMKVEVVL